MDPPVDSSDSRIQQATYNIFADTGVQPKTPSGITLEGNTAAGGLVHGHPQSAQTGQSVTFDGSGSTDLDGTIAKYEWDLDGNGTYETDTGTTPTVTTTYASHGRRSPSGCGSPTTGAPPTDHRRTSSINNGNAPATTPRRSSPPPASPTTGASAR